MKTPANIPTPKSAPVAHTPTPWTQARIGKTQCFDLIGPDVTGRGRELIGNFRASQKFATDEANAALICAAVNSHAANVARIAALEKELEICADLLYASASNEEDEVGSYGRDCFEAVKSARAVLAASGVEVKTSVANNQ